MLFQLLLMWSSLTLREISTQVTHTLTLSVYADTRYQCSSPGCLSSTTTSANTLWDCQFLCLMINHCRTAVFFQSQHLCEMFEDVPGQYGSLIPEVNAKTMTSIDHRMLSARKCRLKMLQHRISYFSYKHNYYYHHYYNKTNTG